MLASQFPVGIRNMTDVYGKYMHSMLEPLQEGFSLQEEKDDEVSLQRMRKDVKKNVDGLNRAAEDYYQLKDFIENDVSPMVQQVYPSPGMPPPETKSQQQLKTQYQDDVRAMIQGTNNMFIIGGVALTSITVFAILSSL